MSISALSSNLITDLSQQQRQNPFQQMKQDFAQLASALQSGDLSTAQSAYANIQQLMQAQPGGSPVNNSTSSTPTNPVLNDFETLGQALQTGDVGQAQSAFSQFQQDVQAARQASTVAPPVQDQYVPSTSQQQTLTITQQVQQDYAQLNSSLQSGDLSGAQSAFANLQQALQSQGTSTTTPATQSTTTSGTDPITNDFNALGSALSSGNLTQAQSAFSQLQNDIQTAQQAQGSPGHSLTQGLSQAVKGHHHHHHHGGGESSTQNSTSTTDSTDSSSSSGVAATYNTTINIYA
jgi:hypothetical protein